MSFLRKLFRGEDQDKTPSQNKTSASVSTTNAGVKSGPDTPQSSGPTAPLSEKVLSDTADKPDVASSDQDEHSEEKTVQSSAEDAFATTPSAPQREWWEEPSTETGGNENMVVSSEKISYTQETDKEVVADNSSDNDTVSSQPKGKETAPLIAASDDKVSSQDISDHQDSTVSQSEHEQEPSPDVEDKADSNKDETQQLTGSATPTAVPLRSQRGFAAAVLRDVGRVRTINQDSVYALTSSIPRESQDTTMGLFIIADGMGGHDGGEIASRLAVSSVVRQVLTDLLVPAVTDNVSESLQSLMISAVQEANRTIWDYARAHDSDMGTTCTAALVLGNGVYVAHVGDSRAYLRTPTGMQCLTADHSAVGRLIEVGQLDPEEAREHPLRSQLYRTVGQSPDVQVDFTYQPIGDAIQLLVCSDGLWGMLDEEVIIDVLDHSLWPQDACHELIARANLAGGEDNISAVVVSFPARNDRSA
ncbi:MAG: protein phosphatase 2C domain-containing protein [Chloroflexota bacterium]